MNVHSPSSPHTSRKIHASGALSTRGMTLVELLCVTFVISILVLMVLPTVHRHPPAYRIKCVNNLKNVGLAYRIWATDNNDLFPFQLSTNNGGSRELTNDIAGQFRVLSNELSTPLIIVCPRERGKEATNFTTLQSPNISYFVGLDASDTNAASILAGDAGFSVNGTKPKSGILRLTATDQILYPKKFHKFTEGANVALGDGSVHQFGPKDMPLYIGRSGVATNHFVHP